MEFFHGVVVCLMFDNSHGRAGAGNPGWEMAGGGCLCLLFVFSVVSAIFFLVWVGNAYANLPILGGEALASIRYRGARVLNPGRESFPAIPRHAGVVAGQRSQRFRPARWSDLAGSKQITVWWIFWVLSALSYLAIIALPLAAQTLRHWELMHLRAVSLIYGMINVVGPVFMVAANVLLIGVIEEIIQRQCKKYFARKKLEDNLDYDRMDDFAD